MRRSRAAALAVLLAVGLVTGCEPRAHDDANTLRETDRAAIRALDSTFVDAWMRDDTTAVMGVFRADAVLLPPGAAPITGLDGIRAYWWPRDGSHTRITRFDRRVLEIDGTRGLAFLRGTGTLGWVYTRQGKTTSQTSRSTDLILVAPDSSGRWRVIRQMWSTLP